MARRPGSGRRRALASALVGAAALTACGGSADDSEQAAQPLGQELAGSVTQSADCGDWNGGTEAERRATIVDIRGHLTGQTDPTADSVLSDDRAYELFEHACKESYAESLRLYKLYVRAAPFEPLRP